MRSALLTVKSQHVAETGNLNLLQRLHRPPGTLNSARNSLDRDESELMQYANYRILQG